MKMFCIGRNYAEHAKELGNTVPDNPIIFIKPSTAAIVNGKAFFYPEFTKNLHYECEIVLRICENGKHISPKFASRYYKELTVGIDFTARDVQDELKKKGHPWEIAKAFDGSAPLGTFVPLEEALNANGKVEFSLNKNGETVQKGNTEDLIFGFDALIVHISKYFTLNKGDLIFTGTPAGVGPVQVGDLLEGFIGDKKLLEVEVR